ncbi:type II toxin-antitoxin system RelE/ParE family toxin [uncultured Shewanella sp.]|uniref:type II toxin-antitoxin system RelE family toxin n=1 Tax=uncultured Shewanella sp. TaxID=173975 RepID=UPI002629F3DE|nr:type II toxin-antitoxin system RelE/ParE family toxin [uncultured Shewanella sp.]
MTYELTFDKRALKEWHKLGNTIKQQFKKKLAEVLLDPRIESNRLRELPDCYKVKLKTADYRMIYQVQDEKITVFVVAIGKRDKEGVYKDAKKRV